MNIKMVFAIVILFFSHLSYSAPSVEDFLKEPDLLDAVISPDGHYLAQLWNKDGARIVSVRDLQQPSLPLIASMSDKVTRAQAISWANNERLLIKVWIPFELSYVERMSKSKADFDINDYAVYARLLSTDIYLKNPVALLNDKSSVKGNTNLANAFYLPKDESHVAMTAWVDERLALFKVDVYTGASEKLATAGNHTFAFIYDDFGNPLYRLDYKPTLKQITIFERVNENGWSTVDSFRLNELETDELLKEARLVSLSKEDLIYRKKNDDTGFYELVKFKRKEKTIETFVSAKDQDIIGTINNRGSPQIVGYTVDGDHIRHKYFDPENQKNYDQLESKLKDYDFKIDSKTTDSSKAIVSVSGADNPLSFLLYNYKTGELSPIADASTTINMSNLATAAIASYVTRDGQKIRAYLLLPPGYQSGKQYPLIVMPHGGPQARDRANYDGFAQFLSTRGYIVIKPNFRGSVGLGKSFEQAGYKQWGQRMQDDVDDAADFMIKKGYADPKRIGILGISYGGYSALMGAVKRPDLYKCAVSINGVTHLRDIIAEGKKDADDPALFEKYSIQRIGDPIADKKMLDDNSPALLTDQINTPLLLIGSEKDDIVPFAQAKTLAKALDKSNKPYTFIKLKESGHNPFAIKKDSEIVHREVEKFFEAQFK